MLLDVSFSDGAKEDQAKSYVVAVEIHQDRATSPDLSFDPELLVSTETR